jgi:hypothetical protein
MIMIRKKSSFLTFMFSLFPGAGQMYMGFMKRGLSLMAMFFLCIFIPVWLRIGLLFLALPIVWFYSFFDTHNLHSAPDAEFYALKDDFILFPEIGKDKSRIFQNKYRNVFAVVLIVIGVSILWTNIYSLFKDALPDYIRNAITSFNGNFPQLFIGLIIILLGIYLIRGKKRELDMEDKLNMLDDKGGR